jgi:hypothetical protein
MELVPDAEVTTIEPLVSPGAAGVVAVTVTVRL